MKKIKKWIRRKKYMYLLMPVIMISLVVFTLFYKTKVDAAVEYKLLTDDNGITWQYSYDAENSVLQIAFFESENEITEITTPDKNVFMSQDSSIGEVEDYQIINYVDHDLGTPIENEADINIIDLSSMNTINGLSPIFEKTVETTITLNPNGSKIGYDVFRGGKIIINNLDKVTDIAGGAFYSTIFVHPDIELNLNTPLGDGAFEYSNVVSVKLNVPVTGYSSFKNCKSLKKVEVLDKVAQIKDSTFEGDSALSEFNYNHIKYLGNNAFKDCYSYNTDISGTELEYIGTGVFWNASSFRGTITIPDSVTIINWYTFCHTGITSIDFNNVTTIMQEACLECGSLSAINLNHVETIFDRAFKNCAYINSIDFGQVQTICWEAFLHCTGIRNLILGDNVKTIKGKAFYQCGLQTIDLKNVQRIEYMAFASNSLRDIYLPKTINYMKDWGVFKENGIYQVTIGFDTMQRDLTDLEDIVEYTSVTSVAFIAPYSANETVAPNRYYNYNTSNGCTINGSWIYQYHLGHDTDPNYGNAMSYKNVIQSEYLYYMYNLQNIEIGEGYEFIGSNFISTHGKKLTKVSLPSTLKGIGINAFESSFKDTSINITLPKSLEYIGYGAFRQSKYAKDVDLPNLKYMGEHAFEYSKIYSIKYNDKLTYVGERTANDCENLGYVTIDCDYFKYNPSPVFSDHFKNNYGSSGYGKIVFTSNVKTSPNFSSTENYKAMFNHNTIGELDLSECAFQSMGIATFNQSTIGVLKLPKNLKVLNQDSFYSTTISSPIELPSGIVSIGKSAFYSANIRISNNLPDGLQNIDDGAFRNCVLTDNLVIPSSVTSMGANALGGNITRPNVTFKNNLTVSTLRGKTVSSLFWDAYVPYITFDENVTELPTNTMNNIASNLNNYSEFYGLNARVLTFKNLKKIPAQAFVNNYGYNRISQIKLEDCKNLEEIGAAAFFDAQLDAQLMLPDSVKVIYDYAFMSSKITFSNNLPKSLQRIGVAAFADTLFQNDIVFPSGITSIGHGAFQGADHYSLYTARNPNIHRNTIVFNSNLTPSVTYGKKISEIFWDSEVDNLVFGENVEELPTTTIYTTSAIDSINSEFLRITAKKVTFKGLKKLPPKAFINNDKLEEIDLSENVNLQEIGQLAFFNASSLTTIKLPQGLNIKVGSHAFYNTALTSIGDEYSDLDVIHNTFNLEGVYTFAHMDNLEEVNFTNLLNEGVIPKGTFASDPKLEKVILGQDMTKIEEQAFAGDTNIKTFVMYGDTNISTSTPTQTIQLTNIDNIYFQMDNDIEDFEIVIKENENETIINKDNFEENKYTFTKEETLEEVEVTLSNPNLFLDKTDNHYIVIRNRDDSVLPIPTTANLYCYTKNQYCQQYNDTYKEQKEANNSSLYYLDEVIYLDSNKNQLEMTDGDTNILTDGLIIYALRRDGIILVSEEWKKLTSTVKYVDSGITIADYDASTTDPSLMIFHTPISLDNVDIETNENFESIEYVIEDRDEETNRIPISFVYQNKEIDSTANTVLKTQGNTANVIYGDGCGGESFANVIFIDVPLNSETPAFTIEEPTRNGYKFIGWDKEISELVTEDVIYTAQWEKIIIPIITPEEPISIVNPQTKGNILYILIPLIMLLLGYKIIKKKEHV